MNKIWIIFTILFICFSLISPSNLGSMDNTESVENYEYAYATESSPRIAKPTGNGQYSTQYITTGIPRSDEPEVPARIYYPSSGSAVDPSGAPYPGIVWAPGAGGYENAYYSQLTTIASWGFIVTIVGTGGPCNQEIVDIQSYVLDYYEALNANTSSIFYNKIAPSYGASGHSNGGWAAIAGGVADSRYNAICTQFGAAGPSMFEGQADTANLHIPLQLVAGSGDTSFLPSSDAYYGRANPIKSYIILQGSGHGGPYHLEYLISFYKFWLANEKEYCTFIYGDSMEEDIALGAVEFQSDVGIIVSASASKSSAAEDEEIIFSGEGVITEPTDPGRTIAKYEWDFDNDGTYDWNSTTSSIAKYMYIISGAYEVKLKVTDTWGLSAVSPISINIYNREPTAVGGELQSGFEDDVVYFDASDSYDTPSDMNTLQFRWDFNDYNTTPWQNESTTSHIFTMEGNYSVRIFVRDDDLDIDSDIVKVSIYNVPPTAVIGYFDGILEIDESVEFNASNSYDTISDTNSLSYSWEFGDSGSADGVAVSHSYNDEGEYTIALTVIDNDGARSTAQNIIKVNNAVPYCSAMADQIVKEDEMLTFNGGGTDTKADEDDLMYSWNLGVDGIPPTPWSKTPEFEYKYAEEGEYIATLTVRDDDGASASATVSIHVQNIAPKADFSVSSSRVNEDETIAFDASDSSDSSSDMESLNYSWEFDDGSSIKYGKKVFYEYPDTGEYLVELTVTDNNGETDSYTKRIKVDNVKPKADLIATAEKVSVGQVVIFSAQYSWDTLSDLEGLTFEWDFGDDSMATGSIASHNYTSPGSFTITLTVTDDDGSIDSAEFNLRVTEFIGPAPEQPSGSEQQEENPEYVFYASGLVIALIVIFIILLLLYLFKSGYRREDEY